MPLQPLNRGYGATQVFGLASGAGGGPLLAGTRSGGTLRLERTNPEGVWKPMSAGVGGFCAADPDDPKVLYGEYLSLHLLRSTDGGEAADEIARGIADVDSQTNLIAPFLLDPNDPNTMLAGGARLWRSTNVKAPVPTWDEIKAPTGDSPASYLSAIAMRRGDPQTVWVGQNDGQVFRTTESRQPRPTWRRVGANRPDWAGRRCTRIVLDPARSGRVYLTFDGYGAGNVWRSTDGGDTWADLSADLPTVPAYALAIHPQQPDWVYLGNGLGLFVSEDGGTHWTRQNEGPAAVPVRDLLWAGANLVAGTNGRGVYQIGLAGFWPGGRPGGSSAPPR